MAVAGLARVEESARDWDVADWRQVEVDQGCVDQRLKGTRGEPAGVADGLLL